MNKNKNVPEIRFKGFSEGWNISKIKKLVDYRVSKLLISNAKSFGKYELFDTTKKIGYTNYSFIKNSYISIVKDGSECGRVRLMQPYTYFTSTLGGLIPKNKFDASFLFARLSILNFSSFMSGGVIHHLYFNEYGEIDIQVPDVKEQVKIGELFVKLDKLFELLKQKENKLNLIKETLLNNMFPKSRHDKPAIRFKGFSEGWKIFAINDIFKITRGSVVGVKQVSQVCNDLTPYPVYSSKTLNNGLYGFYKEFLYQDAITWTTDGIYAGTVRYRQGKFYCTDKCGVLLKKTMKPDYMISEVLNKVTPNHVTQVNRSQLSINLMAEIEVKLPTDEKEREKISDIFWKIDNLIILLKQKENKLNLVKENLLNKMFC
ncbi:restriction endonuclease subunit S [Mycoplasma sp. T363T]|uniref:restriction endonuclease subunit S n=1 Tax=Mycoplasma bradburyae TaxID=2963128 RepID=UPI0023414DC6|nr:restriction endonuclease subunit S [Mycoplasma bradburyae]MDC4163541.1 restriction endonuclease subunit S [Mycoplasma bradburyae]